MFKTLSKKWAGNSEGPDVETTFEILERSEMGRSILTVLRERLGPLVEELDFTEVLRHFLLSQNSTADPRLVFLLCQSYFMSGNDFWNEGAEIKRLVVEMTDQAVKTTIENIDRSYDFDPATGTLKITAHESMRTINEADGKITVIE